MFSEFSAIMHEPFRGKVSMEFIHVGSAQLVDLFYQIWVGKGFFGVDGSIIDVDHGEVAGVPLNSPLQYPPEPRRSWWTIFREDIGAALPDWESRQSVKLQYRIPY